MTKVGTGPALVEAAAKWDRNEKGHRHSNTKHQGPGSTGLAEAQWWQLTQALGRGSGSREGFSKEVMPPTGLSVRGGISCRKQRAEVAFAPLAISFLRPAAWSRGCHITVFV